MSQQEIAKYLKLVTLGIAVLFLLFVAWFVPTVIRQLLPDTIGNNIFLSICIVIWLTAIPCFLCLWKFWGICVCISNNKSFSPENAAALKQMSHFMLVDCVLYVIILICACLLRWYLLFGLSLLFGILLILFICIALTIICASLSHLVYKASLLQEDQDLTI